MRVGGIIELKINGELFSAKGSFTYNLGRPKRDAVVGSDRVHGYKELPQSPYVEGVITDNEDLSLDALVQVKEATITLSLANGKIIVLRDAYYSGDGNVTTEEGEIAVRFDGLDADEVR